MFLSFKKSRQIMQISLVRINKAIVFTSIFSFMLKGEGTVPPSLKHDLFIAQVLPHPVFSYLFEDFHQARQASSCLSFRGRLLVQQASSLQA